MDAHRFDRIARIVGGAPGQRRGRRQVLAGLAALAGGLGAAAAPATTRRAAAAVGRPLGVVCADVLQCSGLGACGWPADVRCESDWGGEPICCLAGGEPCNADIECCGQLSCLMADDSCGAGYCGALAGAPPDDADAGAGADDDADAGAGGWEDASSTPIGVDCGRGIICTGDWETCGVGAFVEGLPPCCLADGAPCGPENGGGTCCHTCLDGTCAYFGRGGVAALEDLNLRTGPGTAYDIIGVVPAGTIVDPQPYWQNGYQLIELPWAMGWVLADGLSGYAG